MDNFKFDDDLNLKLVRGIEKGYSNYAVLRQEKKHELHVSAAYAWVKGNHIEDQVARELEDFNIDFTIEKAGYTWEYLRFCDPVNKTLFLIKGVNIMKDKTRQPTLDADHHDHYLVKLSEINSNIDFDEMKGSKQGVLEFKDLEPFTKDLDNEKIEKIKEKYNNFYILTYNIDRDSRMLSEIDLWMPELKGNSRVEMLKIDSLTKYLNKTGVEINREAIRELTQLPEEELSGTTKEFDFRENEEVKKENE